MAKWTYSEQTWTPSAVADTSNYTDGSYMGLQGGSATQFINVLEVYIGGQAGSSAPSFMVLARDSTVSATTTALASPGKNAPLSPFTANLAAPQVPFHAGTTKPQRSSTLGLLNLSMNAFGGIVKWTWAPGEEIGLYGSTASLGEISLSAYTGGTTGLMGTHIIYEPY